jgi:MFS family permease
MSEGSDRLNRFFPVFSCELLMWSFGDVPGKVSRVVLGAGPLAAGLGFYEVAIAVFLPLEGVSITDVGLILTTFGLAAVVCSIPFSILSDHYGRKVLMFVGALLSMPVTMVPGLTSDFFVLEMSALVGGAAEAMYISTWNAYLADATSVSARPATFSLSFVVFTIGSGLGSFLPALFPMLPLDFLEAHRITFVAVGFAGLLTPFAVMRWVADVRPARSRRGILPRKSLRVLAKFSTANLMVALGAGLIIPLIPTWFYLRFNVTDAFSGPVVAISNILMGLAAIASPSIAKKTGLVVGIVATQLTSTLFLLATPLSPAAPIAAALYVVRSMLMNMSSPLADSLLMNLVAQDERATASALNAVVWRIPNAASTVVGAALLSSGDLSLPFYVCTLLYIASITLFYVLFRRVEQEISV